MAAPQTPLDRVLIGVDGSHCAGVATRVGLRLADRAGAEAEAVYVREHDADSDTRRRADRDRGRAVLDEVGESAAALGVAVRTAQRSGDPATELTDVAADVIVVGRHGRRNLGERLLGSVTDRVLRYSDVPVLVVPSSTLVTDDERADFDELLACTDGSDGGERAIDPTRTLANRCGSRVDVLGVVDASAVYGLLPGPDDDALEATRADIRSAVESFATAVEPDAVSIDRVLREGSPHEEIVDYAEEADIDVVIMASRGQTRLGGRFIGSVTDRVLRMIDRPVLVVPVR